MSDFNNLINSYHHVYLYLPQLSRIYYQSKKMTTTVTIDMDKESVQLATTAILEYFAVNTPSPEEATTDLSLGLQMLCDCLRSTFRG